MRHTLPADGIPCRVGTSERLLTDAALLFRSVILGQACGQRVEDFEGFF